MPKNPESEGSRLITLKQIEQEHGVSRSALHTYRRNASFPQPVSVEGSTRIQYRADAVAAWFEANPPQQGKRTDLATPQQQGEEMDTESIAPLIGEPVANGRGFLTYGGGEIETASGHRIRVQESSSAEVPKVWLFITDNPDDSKRDPHLTLEQAIALHAALGQFIEGVPERWDDGAETLAEARRRALGTN